MPNERRQAKKTRSAEARAARERAARRKRAMKAAAFVAVIALLFTGLAVINEVRSDDESATTCPEADGSSTRKINFDETPANCLDPNARYAATFDTSEGRVVVNLDTERTPNTTNNFVYLSRYSYYDGTRIFRTDPTIDIIQGGSPHTQTNADEGPGYTIQDEGTGFTYAEGDLVMARTGAPNSAGGQFFFATGPDVANLNQQGTYVKFGSTVEGLDVLKKIMELHAGGETSGAPIRPVTVNEVTIQQV